jgi:hypothetical protein
MNSNRFVPSLMLLTLSGSFILGICQLFGVSPALKRSHYANRRRHNCR